nr:B3 domain-containing protein Os03g0212300-like [Aegilops tauschii subsp. strangulata]
MGGSHHHRLRSATPEYELDAFEFFSIILRTSSRRQRLPDTFMKMLDGHQPNNVKLRQAGSGLRRHWDVELVIRYGHMYLCRGWEQFYRAYDLRHGYFLLFRYDSDTMLIDDDDASNGSSSNDSGYSQSSGDSGCSKSGNQDDPEWSREEEE